MLNTQQYHIIKYSVFFLLYLLGFLQWIYFLNYQSPSFAHEDWAYYHQLYSVLKQSVEQLIIPYHATVFATDNLSDTMYGTSRFLANAWMIAPPQLLLLKFVNVPIFITMQYLIFYTIGFLGLLQWARFLNLSIYSSTFLIALFCFNGKLVSLTGMGAPQEVLGYMLIPWFFWILNKYRQNESFALKNMLGLVLSHSLFLAFILLNSDMHVYALMVVVGFCFIIFYPKHFLLYSVAIFLSILFSLWYALPVSLFNENISLTTISEGWRSSGIRGYGDQNGYVGRPIFQLSSDGTTRQWAIWVNYPKYFVNIVFHIYESLTHAFNAKHYNTHEYNLYVGHLGALLLVGGVVTSACRKFHWGVNILRQHRYIFSVIVVSFLAIGPVSVILIKLIQSIVPLTPVNAVPSRYMIFPFFFFLLIASIGFDDMFSVIPKSYSGWLQSLILLFVFWALLTHAYDWWLFKSEIYSIGNWSSKEFLVTLYTDIDDAYYKSVVKIAYLTSGFAVVVGGITWLYLWLSPQRDQTISPNL